MNAVLSRPASLPAEVLAGAVNALTALVAVLLLGIAAAMTAVIAGGLVCARTGSTASPAAMPSSATTVIFAALALQVARDPQLDLSSAQGLLSWVAVLGSAVVSMGLLQIGFGLACLGRLARIVPQPVLAGFISGSVLLILFAQARP